MSARIATILIARRQLWAALSCMTVLLLATGLPRLDFIHDYKIFFEPDDPRLVAHEQLQARFVGADNVAFIIQVRPPGKVIARRNLQSVAELTQAAWTLPYARRVDSLTNQPLTDAAGDSLEVFALFDEPDSLSAEELQRRIPVALGSRAIRDRFISPGAETTLINVTLNLPHDRGSAAGAANTAVMQAARALASQAMASNSALNIGLYGVAPVHQSFQETAFADMLYFGPQMALIIGLVLWFVLRSWVALTGMGIIIGATIAGTMGAAGWLDLPLNQVTMVVPTIVMVLCICDSIHLVVTYFQQRQAGHEPQAAMHRSLEINLLPVLVTSVTTAVGLLCLLFSVSPPFRDLGLMAALGVILAYPLTLSLIPAILLRFPPQLSTHWATLDALARPVSGLVRRRAGTLVLFAMVVSLASIPAAWSNRMVDSIIDYFDDSVPVKQAARALDRHLGGTHSLRYSLSAEQFGDISHPEYINRIAQLTHWLRAQAHVGHVSSLVDLLEELNANFNGGLPQKPALPQDAALIGQYLFAYELLLPYGFDINHLIDFQRTRSLLTVSLRAVKSDEIVAIDQKIRGWLDAHAPTIAYTSASESLMFAELGQRNIRSMLLGSLVALLTMTAVMIMALRSLRIGLLSLIPNLFPIVIAFGVWNLVSGEVNLAAAVIFSMTLGIVVDDTVHFLSRYLQLRRQGDTVDRAIERTLRGVGIAIFATTVVLTLGFLSLARSQFTPNALTGMLVSLTLGAALIYDLLFLPAMLAFAARWRGKLAPLTLSATGDVPAGQNSDRK